MWESAAGAGRPEPGREGRRHTLSSCSHHCSLLTRLSPPRRTMSPRAATLGLPFRFLLLAGPGPAASLGPGPSHTCGFHCLLYHHRGGSGAGRQAAPRSSCPVRLFCWGIYYIYPVSIHWYLFYIITMHVTCPCMHVAYMHAYMHASHGLLLSHPYTLTIYLADELLVSSS